MAQLYNAKLSNICVYYYELVMNCLSYKSPSNITAKLRKYVLTKLHESHLGLTKTMQKAKHSLYWPRMSEDISAMVAGCSACNEYPRCPNNLSLMPTPVANYPFQMIGTDLFQIDGRSFLLTVDYFSKWTTVDPLSGVRTRDVIDVLERVFADFGIPECVRSDNGPQHASSEFQAFLARYGVRHVTSSPGYPRSNGQAERLVQTAKNLLKKCFMEGKSYYPGLLSLRNTPLVVICLSTFL